MIEIKTKSICGVRFIDDAKIVSWERRHGIPVQEVSEDLLFYNEDILKMLMLKEVDHDYSMRLYYYTRGIGNIVVYNIIKSLILAYWRVMYFLYREVRFFKEVPCGEEFSWRYFTPYTWIRRRK